VGRVDLAVAAGKRWPEEWCRVWKPHVTHPALSEVEFVPHPYQERLMRELAQPQPVVVDKARQIGVSTASMMEGVRECVEFGPKTFLVASRKEDAAKELIRIASLAATSHRRPGAPPVTHAGTEEVRWSNGSRIISETASEGTGRTFAASVLVLDEFAFLPFQDTIWSSIRPTASRTGRVWIVSTPNGEGDAFHRAWVDESFAACRMRLPWTECPEYDQAWYERERSHYTAEQWAREFEADFRSSGNVPFRPDVIERALELGADQYALRGEDLRACRGHHVVTGVDPAGEGEDESVALSMDVSGVRVDGDGRAVPCPWVLADGEWWDSVPAPVLQAGITAHQARHSSRLYIENNGLGWAVAQNLECSCHTVTTTAGKHARSDKGDWSVPKTLLLNACILALENGQVAIPLGLMGADGIPVFAELVRQLRSYRWDDKGLRTDWVMALADAVWPVAQSGQSGPMTVHALSAFGRMSSNPAQDELMRIAAPEFIPPEEREDLVRETEMGGYEIAVG